MIVSLGTRKNKLYFELNFNPSIRIKHNCKCLCRNKELVVTNTGKFKTKISRTDRLIFKIF